MSDLDGKTDVDAAKKSLDTRLADYEKAIDAAKRRL